MQEKDTMTQDCKKGRYLTRCTEKGFENEISGNTHDDLQGALARLHIETADPEVAHLILVDTEEKIVELVKGDSVDPFRRMLDKRCPDWSLGTVKR